MSSDDFDDLMSGGGGKSFPFDNVGDYVVGFITSIAKRQQTDLTTGEPKVWGNGEPRFMYSIGLQTELREDAFDDGLRTINVKWKSLDAIRGAVREVGASKPEIGGKLMLKYAANGPKGNYPQPPKLWEAKYKVPEPVTVVETDGFMDGGTAAATPEWAKPGAPAATLGAKTVDQKVKALGTLDLMRQAAATRAIPEDEVPF